MGHLQEKVHSLVENISTDINTCSSAASTAKLKMYYCMLKIILFLSTGSFEAGASTSCLISGLKPTTDTSMSVDPRTSEATATPQPTTGEGEKS